LHSGIRFAFITKATIAANLRNIVKIRKNSGFSLIELIIVMAILGIVLAIAAPNFTKYLHNTNLKTAVRDLAGDIHNTKQTAAAHAVYYEMVFDNTNNNYSIVKCGSNSTDACNVTTASKSPASAAGYIAIDSLTYPASKISFQPRGTISPSGSITLKNDKGSTATITSTIMGKVSVQYNLK
jgi:type IV fimbrial biogenesis protein FimT